MGFSIRYRSTETMHPALAFAIKEHAARLIDGYSWKSCEPVSLTQRTDGYLGGASKPNFFPAEADSAGEHVRGIPDGTVLSLAEVLCTLSREYGVDWDIGHDYEPEPIGRICGGRADDHLVEQLETLGSVGDLFDELFDDEADWDSEDDLADDDDLFEDDTCSKKLSQWQTAEFGGADPVPHDNAEDDDEGPRVLKFPGIE
jgi:hypothetical protein